MRSSSESRSCSVATTSPGLFGGFVQSGGRRRRRWRLRAVLGAWHKALLVGCVCALWASACGLGGEGSSIADDTGPTPSSALTPVAAPPPDSGVAAGAGRASSPDATVSSDPSAAADAGASSALPDSASVDASDSPASDTSEVASEVASASEPAADADRSAADNQVLPPVTFPEASIRDPEAEAADLERRRSVIGLFERLRVEAEHRSGYDRDAVFGGWLYSGGMSTRERVLAAERLADGSWHSAYDNVVVADASKLDIDHLVPLAEAWESGGYAWTAATWRRFGNDLDDPRSLIAVTASTNRSKGAGDPADWLPPRTQYRCRYAADWVAVKTRWELSVDRREQAAIETLIDGCTGADFAGDPAAGASDGLAGTPPTGAAPVESSSASVAQSDAGTDAETESEDPVTSEPDSAEPGSTASCTHWHAGEPKHTHTRRADGTVTGHSHPPSSQTKCGYLWQ